LIASKLIDTKRLELCAPEQWQIDSPCERLYDQLDRLAALGDRLGMGGFEANCFFVRKLLVMCPSDYAGRKHGISAERSHADF